MQDDDDGAADAGQRAGTSEDDDTEAEPVLPTCNGSNGVKGVDCKRGKGDVPKSLAQGSHSRHHNFIQVTGDDKEEAFKYPPSNGFDLPELPECTGMNGPDAGGRKVQCR